MIPGQQSVTRRLWGALAALETNARAALCPSTGKRCDNDAGFLEPRSQRAQDRRRIRVVTVDTKRLRFNVQFGAVVGSDRLSFHEHDGSLGGPLHILDY